MPIFRRISWPLFLATCLYAATSMLLGCTTVNAAVLRSEQISGSLFTRLHYAQVDPDIPPDSEALAQGYTPPHGRILSPEKGDTVSGSVAVKVVAADRNNGPVGMRLLVDGAPLQRVFWHPWGSATVWDSNTVLDGRHTLALRIVDGHGSAIATVPVTVNVRNDLQAPAAQITAPATCSVDASGSMIVSADISDDRALAKAQVLVDGNTVSAGMFWSKGLPGDTSASVWTSVDLTSYSFSEHKISVRVVDRSGNEGRSDECRINVQEFDSRWNPISRSSTIAAHDADEPESFVQMWDSPGGDGGWTGADATVSARLPDGRTVWLFGDTFLGTINENRSRPDTAPMIRNSMVIQDGSRLTTLLGKNPYSATSFLSMHPGEWYWPGAALIDGGKLKIFLYRMSRSVDADAPAQWDFQRSGVDVAILRLPDLRLESIRSVTSGGDEPTAGGCVLADGSTTYIYGTKRNLNTDAFDENHGFHLYVAEVTSGMLGYEALQWRTSEGKLSTNADDAAPISLVPSQPCSAVRLPDGRTALVHQLAGRAMFDRAEFVARASSEPWGEFGAPTSIFRAPIPTGLISYGGLMHPEFSSEPSATMLLSYNLNGDPYSNVENYRARFAAITISNL